MHERKTSNMSAVGQQLMHGNMSSKSATTQANFTGFIQDIELEISEARTELNFCKNEVNILKSEQVTVLEMAASKC